MWEGNKRTSTKTGPRLYQDKCQMRKWPPDDDAQELRPFIYRRRSRRVSIKTPASGLGQSRLREMPQVWAQKPGQILPVLSLWTLQIWFVLSLYSDGMWPARAQEEDELCSASKLHPQSDHERATRQKVWTILAPQLEMQFQLWTIFWRKSILRRRILQEENRILQIRDHRLWPNQVHPRLLLQKV